MVNTKENEEDEAEFCRKSYFFISFFCYLNFYFQNTNQKMNMKLHENYTRMIDNITMNVKFVNNHLIKKITF